MNSLNEFKKYYDALHNITVLSDGVNITMNETCVTWGGRGCWIGSSFLEFGLDQNRKWIATDWTDQDLLWKVHSGKGGNFQGSRYGGVLKVIDIFGGLTPRVHNIVQDNVNGLNNLEGAKATTVQFYHSYANNVTKERHFAFDRAAEKLAREFNKNSTYINVYMQTQRAREEGWSSTLTSDFDNVIIAIYLIVFYLITALGSWSPIHFRSGAAGITFLCVILSYTSSMGIGFLCGFKSSTVHNLIPYLLLGVGVDDVFVIAMSLDQTNPKDDMKKRFQYAMINAGQSITITSFTNTLAFLLGCTSELPALKSFCFFCGIGILCLYFTALTIFAPFMVYDVDRQKK